MILKKPKTVDLDFILLEMYPQYVISTIKEGQILDFPEFKKVDAIFRKYYGARPFVSIADRKYDCTVNPTCYMEPDDTINLKGIAVLARSSQTSEMAAFERKFYIGPFRIFSEMDACIDWALSLLKSEGDQ